MLIPRACGGVCVCGGLSYLLGVKIWKNVEGQVSV